MTAPILTAQVTGPGTIAIGISSVPPGEAFGVAARPKAQDVLGSGAGGGCVASAFRSDDKAETIRRIRDEEDDEFEVAR